MLDLIVKDGFIPDVELLRADVLSRGFAPVTNPLDGVIYSGIQIRDNSEFEPALSELLGFPVRVNTSIARINYEGEPLDNGVHADHDLSSHAAVIYLTPEKCPTTATAFWTDKLTGLVEMPRREELVGLGLSEAELVARLQGQLNDLSKWEANAVVFARRGTAVVYRSQRFHSRFPFLAFGKTPETARLVIAVFFSKA